MAGHHLNLLHPEHYSIPVRHLPLIIISLLRPHRSALATIDDIMDLTRLFLWGSFALSASAAGSLPKLDLAVLGPVYQPAANSSFQAFADAEFQATEALNQMIASGNSTYGPFDNQGTSFSVSVFTVTSDEPLYEFHFEAPELNGSYTKGELSENTIYRTGSLGKLMTVYTWLVDIGDWIYTEPISNYVVSDRPHFQAQRLD